MNETRILRRQAGPGRRAWQEARVPVDSNAWAYYVRSEHSRGRCQDETILLLPRIGIKWCLSQGR